MNTTRTRKTDSNTRPTRKRVKLTTTSGSTHLTTTTSKTAGSLAQVSEPDTDAMDRLAMSMTTSDSQKAQRRRVNKLVPPRPFPTVPTSVSATAPRTTHQEGKNCVCLTRKTSLGTYMRRCKELIIKDGYKTLHLSAMGAAIPLLLQLSAALPPILPFSADQIHTDVRTGTVEVQDELIPEDEDEDITYRTRGKSTLQIIIKIGDGQFDGGPAKRSMSRRGKNGVRGSRSVGERQDRATPGEIVFQEPEQESIEML